MPRAVFPIILACLTAGVVSGCAISPPYVMYEDKRVPLSQTSVLSVRQDQSSPASRGSASIRSVDGIRIGIRSCHLICPVWVRVLPGSHSFTISYEEFVGNFKYGGTVLVPVADMKAQHVYVVRLQRVGSELGASVEDLGENPEYGFKHRDGRYLHRVTFE